MRTPFPFTALDIESTGTDPYEDQIVELGLAEFSPHLDQPKTLARRFKPGLPISKGAAAVHGITNEFLADKPLFATIADDFLSLYVFVLMREVFLVLFICFLIPCSIDYAYLFSFDYFIFLSSKLFSIYFLISSIKNFFYIFLNRGVCPALFELSIFLLFYLSTYNIFNLFIIPYFFFKAYSSCLFLFFFSSS
jgi:hypothetical protein